MGIECGDIAELDRNIMLCYDIKCAVVFPVKDTQIIPLNQMYITPNGISGSYRNYFLFTYTRRDTECFIFSVCNGTAKCSSQISD